MPGNPMKGAYAKSSKRRMSEATRLRAPSAKSRRKCLPPKTIHTEPKSRKRKLSTAPGGILKQRKWPASHFTTPVLPEPTAPVFDTPLFPKTEIPNQTPQGLPYLFPTEVPATTTPFTQKLPTVQNSAVLFKQTFPKSVPAAPKKRIYGDANLGKPNPQFITPTEKKTKSLLLNPPLLGFNAPGKPRQPPRRTKQVLKDISNIRKPPLRKPSIPTNSKTHHKLSPECEHHIRLLISQGITAEHIRKDVCGRHSLDVNSKVMIYSVSQQTWFSGIVTAIHNDTNGSGEWLKIEYGRLSGRGSSKLVKRFDKEIMPFPAKPDHMSNEEGKVRESWIIGSPVEVHSLSQKRWIPAKVVSIDYDREGEWLRLLYVVNPNNNRKAEKQVKRFSADVRPEVLERKRLMSLPIPIQDCDPVITVDSPLPFDANMSQSTEGHIPLWAQKDNVQAWINDVQDQLDPEDIFPTNPNFKTVDLANMFESSITLATSSGKRHISDRRRTGDWDEFQAKEETLF